MIYFEKNLALGFFVQQIDALNFSDFLHVVTDSSAKTENWVKRILMKLLIWYLGPKFGF